MRQQLEKKLGFRLPDQAWKFLIDRLYVAEVEQRESTIPALSKEVREFYRAFGDGFPERRPTSEMLPSREKARDTRGVFTRQQALSILLAEEAASDESVRDFRSRVLHDALPSPYEVEKWVRQQAKADGPATTWLTGVPVPRGHKIKPAGRFITTQPPLTISSKHAARGLQTRFLEYAVPGDKWSRLVPTAAGGVLEQLRHLSGLLARQYRWTEAQAVLFVLTGRTPLVALINATTSVPVDTMASARITLIIDPALSPREVASAYRGVRRTILEGPHRSLSEKHTRLAVFAAGMAEEETWAKGMAAWNRKYPKWQYGHATNFGRDCVQAQRRLLRPNYRLAP